MNVLLRLTCVLVALLAFAPSDAPASFVGTWGSNELYYNAISGELNKLTVSALPSGVIRFSDPGATSRPEGNCVGIAAGVTDCPAAGITLIVVRLEDGDDTVTLDVGIPAHVWGHDGNDRLTGGSADDKLYGGWGDDMLTGRGGADFLDGGGQPNDTASYVERTVPVTVQLWDSSKPAGAPGEGDKLWAISDVLGGLADDNLQGDERDNELLGGAGNDVISGGRGNDRLTGGDGNDRLWPAGVESDADAVVGGPGTDIADYSNSPFFYGVCPAWGCGDPDPSEPTLGVDVTLDDLANDGVRRVDGASYERDNVASDIEKVIGSQFNDRLVGNNRFNELDGGPGGDLLEGGEDGDILFGGTGGARDVLNGGRGGDVLDGGGGADDIMGNEGDDFLIGGPDGDLLAGDGGFDTASYFDRSTAVQVTLNETKDDGEVDTNGVVVENDNVVAERVLAGSGNDILIGSTAGDTLEGGLGNDRITGGGGVDNLYGDGDADTIEARDLGPDLVYCGPGADSAQIDQSDVPVFDCETTNDVYPPRVSCGLPNPNWTASNQSVQCTAFDPESGLQNPADASFTLTTDVDAGKEDGNISLTRDVDDKSGNKATATAAPFKVDRKGPTVSSKVPDARFLLNEVVPWDALVQCIDYGSGVKVLNGRPRCADTSPALVPTSSAGSSTFYVLAQDNVNNHSTTYLPYAVGYELCNPTVSVDATYVKVFVSLCDANGVNVSDSSIALENLLIEGARPESRGGEFEYTNKTDVGYVLRIRLDAISSGGHELTFTAGLDPLVHTLRFEVP